MIIKNQPTAIVAGALVMCAQVAPAIGQDLPGGLTFSYGLESEFRVNDNLGLDVVSPGVSAIWDNRLTLGFLSQTPVSELELDFGVTLRTAALPGQTVNSSFDEPFAIFGYNWEGPNSSLEADASWRRVNLDFIDPMLTLQQDGLDSNDFIVDSGSRTTTTASFSFEHGLNDPLGFGFDLGYFDRDYTGTTDPDLFDTRTLSASAFTRFRFSPIAEGRLTASWSDYVAADADQTNRDSYGLLSGLTYEINPITIFDGTFGYNHITETTNVPSRTVQKGLIGSVELTREMTNGWASVLFDSGLGINGRRNTLSAQGALEFPTGELTASLGVTRGSSGNLAAIGSLDYAYELARGTFVASLDHSVTTNSAGNDQATTSATVGYTTEINRVSALSFEADFASVADFGVTPTDRTSLASLRAAYSYELTESVDLTAGYEYRLRNETGQPWAHSNEIFLLLEHRFDARR